MSTATEARATDAGRVLRENGPATWPKGREAQAAIQWAYDTLAEALDLRARLLDGSWTGRTCTTRTAGLEGRKRSDPGRRRRERRGRCPGPGEPDRRVTSRAAFVAGLMGTEGDAVMSDQYVVILTGGARPGDKTSHHGPSRNQLDLAVERGTNPDPALMARHVAEEGYLIGFAEAAMLQRVVAVWVLDDKDEAGRFAEFVTREIDPAYVTRALSPLNEVLNAADEARQRAVKDEVAF